MTEPTADQLKAELTKAQAIVMALTQQRDAQANEAAMLRAQLALIQAAQRQAKAEQEARPAFQPEEPVI